MILLEPASSDHSTSPEDIDASLRECIKRAEGDGIDLSEALVRLGPASFCFVCLLLSVPFIQPFSLGPYNMASGLTFMAAGWQMTRGYDTPRLPKAMRHARLHGRTWVVILGLCQKTLRVCRRFTKPRWQSWVVGRAGERLVGWLILIGGFLLAIPVAHLPLNNTLPALMILSAAIAWLEKDGLFIFISLAWGVASLLYFVVIGTVIWLFGSQITAWIHSFWK